MTFGALSKTSASRPRLAIACCTCTIFSRYQSGGRRSGRFGAAACKETPKLRVRPNIEDREVKVKTAVPTALRRNSRRTRESMARSGTRVERHHLSPAAFRREGLGSLSIARKPIKIPEVGFRQWFADFDLIRRSIPLQRPAIQDWKPG